MENQPEGPPGLSRSCVTLHNPNLRASGWLPEDVLPPQCPNLTSSSCYEENDGGSARQTLLPGPMKRKTNLFVNSVPPYGEIVRDVPISCSNSPRRSWSQDKAYISASIFLTVFRPHPPPQPCSPGRTHLNCRNPLEINRTDL